MGSRPKGHGYAAFAKADVADAKRGRPDGDLREHARARGLEWLDRARPAGFSAAVPGFEEYRYNVLRGVLPGGAFGVLFHQLLEVPAGTTPSLDGKLYGVLVKTPGRWWVPSLPDRTDIPFIGFFLDPPGDDGPAEAFDSRAVWIPTTTAAVNVPEATLDLCLFRIDRRGNHAPFDFEHKRKLDDLGLPGWRMRSHVREPTDAFLGRLLNGPVADLFRRRADDPYFQLLMLRGTLIVRCNGYVLDGAVLDRLTADASLLAESARAACLPEASPRPFGEPLPAPHSHDPEVTPGWTDGYRRLAERLGLTLEDPDDYHRAFPSLGVPGRAVAVMRGQLPGTSVTGRLVYHAELALKHSERARGAVLLPAPPGAQATPPGGVKVPERQLVYEHRDAVTVLWSLRTAGFLREEQDDLIARAVELARERGLGAGG